ncbi:TIGR02569 family protein [Streptomyces spiroverticillatus]|uniref:TIGR02569 family protein n=1 Tax=Streptomyces finlayi TaxID=67296 RepID=A0A918X268_9ACTN|nr:aminoglycoside phosphotransferase [Streptomyces finlayi]GHA23167.1 TIGR02569 family protein [Streptomyces spiroverticillatus]GHD04734.1 TIGR02569 family protein [Streptomyces finlayi]
MHVPPPAVLEAFGVRGEPVPLTGGQGRSVRVGGYVFKPADATAPETEWAARLHEGLAAEDSFRVPRPLRTPDGRSTVDGWTAAEYLTGEPGPQGRWAEVLAAGRAFHRALRGSPRPDFLARRDHPWAVADRVACGEQDLDLHPDLAAPFVDLLKARSPLAPDPAQLVHGDLTGNVLFPSQGPPVVIDFSPYWRPPLYAEAIVVADGLLWYDLPSPQPPGAPAHHPDWQQTLLRALLFRLVAHSELTGPSAHTTPGESARYTRATAAALTARPPTT